MRYTTGWARKDCKTQEQWVAWLNGLKDGDRVLFQQFVPRGRSCLESQVQCWRFWPAVYRGNVVFYNNDTHPIKDGLAASIHVAYIQAFDKHHIDLREQLSSGFSVELFSLSRHFLMQSSDLAI